MIKITYWNLSSKSSYNLIYSAFILFYPLISASTRNLNIQTEVILSMYQPPYPTSNRITQSLKLATIHSLAVTGYILVLLILFSFLFNNGSLVGFLLLLMLLPIIIVTGMLAAYIYTTSFSRHFACRIGYIQAIQISISIGFQLFMYSILALIITGFIFYVSIELGFLLFMIEYLLFPLTVFYFVQEWVLENRGNTQLSRNPNPNFVGFADPVMRVPIQHPNQQYIPPQYVPQQQYQQPQYQQQQPTIHQTMNEQPGKAVQSEIDESPVEKKLGSTLNFCSHCGGKVDNSDVQYCGSCGRPVNN